MKQEMLRAIIIAQIMQSDAALEEALLAIYQRQTRDEQSAGTTTHQNGVGFTGIDANRGTYCAKWLLDDRGNRLPHRHLTGRFLVWARKAMPKYGGQLASMAEEGEVRYLDRSKLPAGF